MKTLRQLWAGGCESDNCNQGRKPCPTPELCHRAANYRRVMEQPITKLATVTDDEFCVWACRAAPGDVWEWMHSERCACVARAAS